MSNPDGVHLLSNGAISPPALAELHNVLVAVPPALALPLPVLAPQPGGLLALLVGVLEGQRLHLPPHVVIRPVPGHLSSSSAATDNNVMKTKLSLSGEVSSLHLYHSSLVYRKASKLIPLLIKYYELLCLFTVTDLRRMQNLS